ncbi:MAG: nickel/cobalt transporter [Xanthobacteraceae bacterium]
MRKNFFSFRALAALLVAAIAVLLLIEPSLAQNPFGQRTPPPSGFMGWILAQQSAFYQQMAGAVKAAKADGSALWTLVSISFLYGVFHAAGPGHGKAVISSYLIADDATWKRGALLAIVSALVQALVAIAVVGIAAVLLGATARTMSNAVRWIEIAAYSLIVLFGLYLLWKKGRSFFAAWRGRASAHDHYHDSGHGHHDHRHAHDHAHTHAHHHDHDHVHDEHCGHSHGPEPAELKGDNWFKRGMVAAVTAGMRPCSGAILVLVFALAQGIFLSGVAATFAMSAGVAITVTAIAVLAVFGKSLAVRLSGAMGGRGDLMLRGIEVLGALFVIAFGVLLLTGYLASERLLPV